MKKFSFDMQLITKIAGGIFTVLGLSLLIGDNAYQKKRTVIEVPENDISVSDASDDQVAKKASN